MAKETYYFQHDYEPTSDPKIQALLGEFGGVGYGIFWRIVEMLHSDETHKLPKKKFVYSAIAKQMSTSVEQLEAILEYMIDTCELFQQDSDFIWSERVLRNIDARDAIREKRSIAGKASAEARKKATLVEHLLTHVQQNPTKEKKGKEIKEKESKVKGSKEELAPLVYPFDSENFMLAWNVLIAQPKWKNKTQAAYQTALKKLSLHNEADAIEAIEDAIAGGYQGVFTEKFKKQSNGDSKTPNRTYTDADLKFHKS